MISPLRKMRAGSTALTTDAEAEAEVVRGGLQRRDRLAVAAARPRDEVVHGEGRDLGGDRLARRDLAAEVARQRREVRDVRLPAAVGAARARRAVDVERRVAELAGDVVAAADHLAVDDEADAEAVGDREEHEVAAAAGLAAHAPDLRDGAGAARVLDVHGQAGLLREQVAQREVAPAEARGERDAGAGAVHHAGDDQADALALAEFLVVVEDAPDAARRAS